ncbi:MAG: glutathione synthase [Alphaproteobacteria bacterium]|nr:glutathione synthase [Alphaproteobacteria bacterium]
MSLNIAIQMDDPHGIDFTKNTTFILALEAQQRGYSVEWYNSSTLALQNKTITAICTPIEFKRKANEFFTEKEPKRKNLEDFTLILLREDFTNQPSYTAAMHILEHLREKTLILNDPEGIRESPEKILITHYPELAPETLITRDYSEIELFVKKHKSAIIKPLNGYGGLDIFKLIDNDPNTRVAYEMLSRLHSEPFIVQEYLPAVRNGDKRIIVVEGEPIAAYIRIPAKNEVRAGYHRGSKPAAAEITKKEREMCAVLRSELIKRGLCFVGIDVIGERITEINPKSPAGLQAIYRLSGVKCEKTIWDTYEARLKAWKKRK